MKTITENTVIENNKLIADFMGLKIITDGISFFDTDYNSLKKYNSSWDYLIPVVEKIENLGFVVKIWKNYTAIYNKKRHCLIDIESENKIEACCEAIIYLIKWYNQNK